MNNPRSRTVFLIALLFGAAAVSFFVLQPFLTTIALAIIFAVVLQPIHKQVSARLGKHTGISALVTLVIGTVLVLTPVSFVGVLIVDQTRTAYTEIINGSGTASAEQVGARVGAWLDPYIPGASNYANAISVEINTYAKQALQWVIERIGGAFASMLGILLRLLIFMMALYYFLKDGAKLEKMLIKESPLLDEDATTIAKRLSNTINSVVKGSLAIACIQGTLAGIGYFLFGIPNASLWGVCTAVAALIPGVGTSLVLIPAVIYLFAVGSNGAAIGMLLWGTLLVGLIDNFLAPRLMGHGAKLHPLATLLSVLGGVALYGPVGIFLGPITLSFLFAVYVVYTQRVPADA